MLEFMKKFEDAAEKDLLVTFVVNSSTYQIYGGRIDTVSYTEYDDSIELHTKDGQETILLRKTSECSVKDIDPFSKIYMFGDLGIIITE